jgi:hypothetical protein
MWRAIFMLNLKYVRRVWRYQREVIRIRKSKTDNTVAKRKMTKGQTSIYKIYMKIVKLLPWGFYSLVVLNQGQWNWYLLLLWLSMQQKGQRAKIDWLWIRIICQRGATYILVKCCFSELALYKSNYSMLV